MYRPKEMPQPHELRQRLDAILDDVIGQHGPRHPHARLLTAALNLGDDRALGAAWRLWDRSRWLSKGDA